MFLPSLNRLWLQCIPLPLIPKNGFGMNVTWYPRLSTNALIACLNVTTASAVFSASSNLKSTSCCPGATSWWLTSMLKFSFSRPNTISFLTSIP